MGSTITRNGLVVIPLVVRRRERSRRKRGRWEEDVGTSLRASADCRINARNVGAREGGEERKGALEERVGRGSREGPVPGCKESWASNVLFDISHGDLGLSPPTPSLDGLRSFFKRSSTSLRRALLVPLHPALPRVPLSSRPHGNGNSGSSRTATALVIQGP